MHQVERYNTQKGKAYCKECSGTGLIAEAVALPLYNGDVTMRMRLCKSCEARRKEAKK